LAPKFWTPILQPIGAQTDRRVLRAHFASFNFLSKLICALGSKAAIALALVENGWRVLFMRTGDLVQSLQIARRGLALESALAKLDKYHLLVLDDIVHVSKDQAETSVLFALGRVRAGDRREPRSGISMRGNCSDCRATSQDLRRTAQDTLRIAKREVIRYCNQGPGECNFR
jgi:hypothetical protein